MRPLTKNPQSTPQKLPLSQLQIKQDTQTTSAKIRHTAWNWLLSLKNHRSGELITPLTTFNWNLLTLLQSPLI